MTEQLFLSTLPARGATRIFSTEPLFVDISIHAPREGSDRLRPQPHRPDPDFYPRSPRGERPGRMAWPPHTAGFLSTLPARGATGLAARYSRGGATFLSTLPARGATNGHDTGLIQKTISIHAPREGSDPIPTACARWPSTFLSTLPARGATRRAASHEEDFQFLSTLPARGATGHAPSLPSAGTFLSTLPARGATTRPPYPCGASHISIHAPREGSDKPDC